ncbi:Fe-S-containing protein [Fusobacterium russii]|uniref:Fe-S-containing protein n=1 Tax=Fusobacterium russii TaxID=854 RepID=UPI0003A97394|nr:Fe-S-containing protein [Fusobacterium russii]
MLKFFINVIDFLSVFSFLFGINFSILNKNKNFWIRLSIAIISFIGLSGTVVLTTLRGIYPQKMVKFTLFYNRWALALGMFSILISLILLLIYYSIEKSKKDRLVSSILFLYESFSFVAIWCLAFTIFPQVYALSKEFVAFGEDSFGTQSLIRLGGYLLGFLVIILLSLSTYKVNIRLRENLSKIFSISIVVVASIDFFLRGVAALARLRILKAKNPFVFNIMIWEDKSLAYILSMFTIIIVIFSVFLFLNSLKIVGEFKNKAMLRKEKARLIKNKRWANSLIFFTMISLFSVTFLHSYINKPVELSPPEHYIEDEKTITIPLSDVEDGHLHRFSYIADGGNNVRFIVVKKPKGGSYGVGLDACDICGLAGYYERDDEVVCKRCDVVMNKSTIGFKGGCNPVPFEYEIKDKKIIIEKATLEREKERFPVGE